MSGPDLAESMQAQPLVGLRVLDFSHIIAGPIASMMLADLGADVVKIESAGGDRARQRGAARTSVDGHTVTGYLAAFNRGKRSVVLDLKSQGGHDAAMRLAAEADVVIENFGPGTMSRLGLDLAELRRQHPRLVTVSISLFAAADDIPSIANRRGLAIIAEAESGLASQRTPDGAPTEFGFPLGDHLAGQEAFGGIMLGLYTRAITGVGRHVDVSMIGAALRCNASAIASYSVLGYRDPDLMTAIYGYYEALDGYLAIALSSDDQWQRFAAAIGFGELAEDERYRTYADRSENRAELIELVTNWSTAVTCNHAIEVLERANVPCGRVRTATDIASSPFYRDLGLVSSVDDGIGGSVVVPSPAYGPTVEGRSIPRLGQHTDEVLRDAFG